MALFGQNLSVQRCLTFATGLVECLCFAGAVFGWASLVFVLKSDSYFSSLCVNATESNGSQVLGEFQRLTSQPSRAAVRRPTSLKDSRTGLKLWHDLFFPSVSQTAAAKMNSSLWCSPPPPL